MINSSADMTRMSSWAMNGKQRDEHAPMVLNFAVACASSLPQSALARVEPSAAMDRIQGRPPSWRSVLRQSVTATPKSHPESFDPLAGSDRDATAQGAAEARADRRTGSETGNTCVDRPDSRPQLRDLSDSPGRWLHSLQLAR